MSNKESQRDAVELALQIINGCGTDGDVEAVAREMFGDCLDDEETRAVTIAHKIMRATDRTPKAKGQRKGPGG